MFEKILGNEEQKKYLEELIKTRKIANSYMFTGIEGIGKKEFAKEFSKNIMCLNGGSCSDKCDACIKFNAGSNPDFMIIEPDGKAIKINQVRQLQEDIAKKPVISDKKVYIIDNADLMTEESQNCLLKTLEEPPKYAVIILIVENEEKLLLTIKSRCVIVKFNKITDEELRKAKKDLTDEEIEILNGSFKNFDKIEEKVREFEELKNIVSEMKSGNIVYTMNNAKVLYDSKENINELLNFLNIIFFRESMLSNIEIVEKTKSKLRMNNNYEMCIDNLIMKCCENSKNK